MKQKRRHCRLCPNPISITNQTGLCHPCAMRKVSEARHLAVEGRTAVPILHSMFRTGFEYYGIHKTCRGCPHNGQCAQYAAPNSRIVTCPANPAAMEAGA
jgi:hypothetical protein